MSYVLCSLLLLMNSKRGMSQPSDLLAKQDPYFNTSSLSPQTFSFIKQGSHEMNLFNGQVLFQIPIYFYKDKDFNIPISLTYNSSGFMPNQREGIIGLGWSMAAGASIARVVNGVPDDYYIAPNRPNGLLYGIRNNLQIKSVTKSSIFNLTVGTIPADFFWNIGGCEAESDLFSFNVPGLSGRFYIENNGEVRTIGSKPFKVDLSGVGIQIKSGSASSNVVNSSIVLTTDDGFKYYFGGNASNLDIVFSLDESGDVYDPTINTWHLTKIIAPSGQIVEYKYKVFDKNIHQDNNPNDKLHYLLNVNYLRVNEAEEYIYAGGAYGQGGISGLETIESATKTTYLEEIVINGKASIKFFYIENENKFYKDINLVNNNFNQKNLRLSKIEVKDYLQQNRKEFEFTQAYLGGAESRLFLSSFKVAGEEPYVFTYHNTSVLPSPSTGAVDHWGYWNGSSNLYGATIPTTTYYQNGDVVITGIERNPDITKCKTAMLAKVVYPTGGYTLFDYEAHSYSKRLERKNDFNFLPKLYDVSGNVGGARISKITDSDGTNSFNIREFKYTKDYPSSTSSSGILLQWPRYLFYWEDVVPGTGTSKHLKMRSSSFNNTYLGTDNFIQYSEVTEVSNGNGYTNYLFTDYISNPDENDYRTIKLHPTDFNGISNINLLNSYVGIYFNDRYFERGIAKRIRQYKFNGGSPDSLVKETKTNSFTGQSDFPDAYIVGAHITGSIVQSYKKYYYPCLPKQVEETTYGSSGLPKILIQNYQYNNYGYLTKHTTTQSDGTIANGIISYPNDYATGTAYLDDMKSLNLLKYPIEKVNYNEIDSSKNILSGQIIKYKPGGKGLIEEVLDLETINPIPIASFKFSNRPLGVLPPTGTPTNFSSDSKYNRKIKFSSYDSDGNLHVQQRENNFKQSFEWGYNSSYPIVEIKNAENSLTTTTTTGTAYGSLNMPSNSASTSFTTAASGNIVLSAMGDPGNTYTISYTLNGPANRSGILCASRSSTSCSYPETATLTGMPAGNYSLSITLYSGSGLYTGISFTYPNIQTVTTGIKEFFFEGFEENVSSSAVTGTSHSGRKYWNTNYTTAYTKPNSRSYVIQWWNLSGGKWIFNQQPFTTNVTLTGPVDDVRIFPADAMMTSYTYDPLIGMTSQTDPAGKTITYEYDSFGRLKTIRDQDRNVIKTMDYQYQKPNNQ
ncbi:MAG: RHS repeat protein [Bacteroidetes bacterium]|nr:RHS repeat protein [Bacteroidota bacterium]